MAINTFIFGLIDGVKFSPTGSTILVGGFEYYLSDISEILNPSDNGGVTVEPGGDDTDG
jgi:hypothetical protein